MKTVNPVTLDEVNSHLLERLNDLINNADPEEILQITEAVAKLNSSWKGNDQFSKPQSSEERSEQERNAVLGEVLNG